MPQITKKRKRSTPSAGSFKDVRQKIRMLEASLSDKSNLNNLVEIRQFAQNDDAQIVHAAIHSLHRVFTSLITKGEMRKPKSVELTAKDKVTIWLREQYFDYQDRLRALLAHEEPGLQIPALNILMTLLKTESETLTLYSQRYAFANDFYGPIVNAIIRNPNFSQPLRNELLEKYLNVYDDLRHYLYKDIAEILGKESRNALLDTVKSSSKKQKTSKGTSTKTEQSLIANNAFSIIEAIRTMPTDASEIDEFWTGQPEGAKKSKGREGDQDNEDDMDDLLGGGLLSEEEDEDASDKKKTSAKSKPKTHPLLQLRVHQRSFSECWLAVLKLPLTEEIYKKTLLILHKRVLPHLVEPKLLMDFLTDSYNVGGATSLLALNGLFTLITEHNLDYPDFYHKLYTLLDRNIMHVKFRSRFFRLLDIFLSSAYLPATLVAAFIKRLARLSLNAPPAASVIIIPFIYNLLKRHPTCMKLIHSHEAIGQAEDPYRFEEGNPYEAKALESSLWEVQTLAQHYYANVATLAKIFSEQFLKPKYVLEDFLDHTYATVRRPHHALKKKKNHWKLILFFSDAYSFSEMKLIASERRNRHWR
ncbi:CBF/Mak21 family-domain-containing protein [Radiomyces spectabilis]|uniref:CBF/Mak21 family-domain-containing protein n=1 Tax=Radiomyces spectabilis TaxID=64574 RepID=UPI002220BEA0|nr:CBF/Mak21 family-domain-containing protein [Radiomyces spectabilis]KAI8376161.1 CBF/Mak21 family-domain-containing protein [Radiomyces spectabilis]